MLLKPSLLVLTLIIIPGWLSAQQLTSQDWQTENDYREVEDIVLKNILWLESNPLSMANNDTKSLTTYVLNWLSGTPYVAVKYDEIFLSHLTDSKKYKFGEKFRITYLFGKAYYLVTNQSAPSEIESCVRGIEGMVTVYEELKKIDPEVRHARLEKYSRLAARGKLSTYVAIRLEKTAKEGL